MELVISSINPVSLKSADLFDGYIKNFISGDTQKTYLQTFNKFSGYCLDRHITDIQVFTHLMAIEFRDFLVSQQLSNHSVNREISAMSSCFKFFKNKGFILENPFQDIRRLPATNKNLAVFPNDRDIEKILNSFEEDSKHRLFFEVLSVSGQRLSTILNLRKKDFVESNIMTILIRAKGSKTKILPLPIHLNAQIKTLLSSLGDEAYLFSTDGLRPWLKANINTVLKRRCAKLGIRKNITPHSMRRHTLNRLLKKGFDPLLISETVSFHSDLNTLIRHYKTDADYTIEQNPLYSNILSGDEDFRTPRPVFEALNAVFGFEVDIFASLENKLCEKYFSKENCAFENEWGQSNFANPPYTVIKKTVDKCIEQASKGRTTALLIPSRTENYYFTAVSSGYLSHKIELQGRIQFDRPVGLPQMGSSFSSMVLVFGGKGLDLSPLNSLGLVLKI